MGSTDETQITPTHVSDEEANLFAMQLASASILPMVLKSAIELDILEIIAKAGPGVHLSPTDIASKLPTTNPDAPVMLDRILRLLANYSILTYTIHTLNDGKVERLYGLAPVARYLVKNEDGVSLSALSLMNQNKVLMESWSGTCWWRHVYTSLATKGVIHMDVIMLAHNPGGKERTEKEFEALAKGAGFKGFRVFSNAFNTYIMEFLKEV
ncbi:unnamed protein product [Lupinus luteus]|uniref:Uncharacterized protein n=1 Tax=Lupinus luteus TaxID=3873 RepID=A0AAV1Y307_LUPLU